MGIAGLCVASAAQSAATINVTTTAMTIAVDGNCSLPEAVQAANTAAVVDGCDGTGGAPFVIELQADQVYSGMAAGNVDGFYGASLLVISAQVELRGNGAVIERSPAAAGNFRIVRTCCNAVQLRNVTLRGGNPSDAVAPAGSYGGGVLIGGGGIIELDRVTVSGNSGSRGAGLLQFNATTVNILDSLFTGNSGPEGVFLFSNGSTTNVANTTVTDNATRFSLSGVNMGLTTIRHVTADTVVVFSGVSNLDLTANIFLGGCSISATTTVASANFAPASCAGSIGTDASVLPLASNGGPTATRALSVPSLAASAHSPCTFASFGSNSLFADGAAITTDQRGAARGASCDRGAFEAAQYAGSGALSQGVVGVAYVMAAQAISGGTAPYGAAATSAGVPPPGLAPSSTSAGELAWVGTPTAAGNYAFTTRVVDANGMAFYRDWTMVVIDVPGAPVLVGSSNDGNGALTLSFTPPASNGNSAITGYRVKCDAGAYVSASSLASPITITGLPHGVAHSCQVFATNAAGEGSGSAVASLSLPATTVVSIVRAAGSPTSASSATFTVTFSRAVAGVDAADFALVTSGLAGASVTNVSGTGTSYTVTVSTGTGSGTLRLDLGDDDSIVDASTGVLGGPGAGNGSFTAGELYTLDRAVPAVASISRVGAATIPPGTTQQFTVVFNEAVAGVDAVDFALATTGAVAATITGVSGSGTTFTVTVDSTGAPGTIRLDVIDNDSIVDAVGNVLGGAGAGNGSFTAGQVYTVADATLVASIVRAGASPTAAVSVSFTVTFSRAVTGGDVGDFTLAATGVTGASVTAVAGSGAVYTVTVATGAGSGTLRLDVADDDTITDGVAPLGGAGAGNGSFATGPAYTFDRTAPAVLSIVRVGPASVVAGTSQQFTVTFGEPVTGVDPADFTLTATGATASIVSVAGSGATYTVTISITAAGATGGTVRLDLADNDSIADAVGNLLGGTGAGNGSFATGESFTVAAANKSFTGPSATGSGTIAASFTGGGAACSFSGPQFIPLTGHARSPGGPPPQGTSFPHGLFDFTLVNCTPGSTVSFTITYPGDVTGLQYFKFGPMPGRASPSWYVLPAAVSGNTITFSITDGQLGDDDLVANGTIVDQGGPGTGLPPGATIPTMSEWMLLLMGLALFAMAARRSRQLARA